MADIAKALCYCDGDSIACKWKEEVCVFSQKDLPGVNLGARMVRFITRDGLLAFLLSSPRPMAQLLRKWIIDDVLPSADNIAFDMDTGQSALDKAILKELDALKTLSRDVRKKRDEQIMESVQGVARAILSWVDRAPVSHVRLFQKALQEVETISQKNL